jgi:outer membrane receptor for ferrienterochelin and colicin
LFNGAPVFNSSHLFGFFSSFNPDIVNDFQLYKSGIPAQYGGRISSVMDISSKTGNRKEFAGNGGISPITGRISFEGPIIKDKVSFILGARSTYSDWVLKQNLIPVTDVLKKSAASFYDLNAKITADIGKNNTVEVSGYLSNDLFRLASDTSYNYSNKVATISWRHIYSTKLISNISFVNSYYNYKVNYPSPAQRAYSLLYNIGYNEVKTDFSYFPVEKHRVKFGLNSILYSLMPGEQRPEGKQSLIKADIIESEKANETGLYIGDEWDISNALTFYAGLRYTQFSALGPKIYNLYASNVNKEISNKTDTVSVGNNKVYKTYQGFEPRLSLRLKVGERSSVKISYNRMLQYMHMMSNTTAVSPTDIWKLSDYHLTPQIGDQIALGYYQDFYQDIETSVEVYYKKLTDILDYKGGAKLTMNHNIETELLRGNGKAYGVEVFLKKKMGRFNGWVGYTYSRILHRVNGPTASEKINNGEWFPANYDKPHDVNIILNYKFSRRFNISANSTYSTGRPITLPVAKYKYAGTELVFYSNRNEFRVPDYFRVDFAATYESDLRLKKLAHSSLTFSVYNLFGRRNVYSIYFVSDQKSGIQGYKMSVFGNAIPTLTYNFRF